MPSKPLGIVIPTYNRPAALLTCLGRLEGQTFKNFEVVIVDDGSTDDTADQVYSFQQVSNLSLRYVRQENGGPAKARNLGISMLEAPLCLMLGDDIFAAPTLLQMHVDKHNVHPDMNTAVLGLTHWSTEGQTITPFMKWIDATDMQFAYNSLLAGQRPDWHHFYTSNLSVKTGLLRRFPFDETFPFAAMEDTDLAYRIHEEVGLEVIFVPEAFAEHFHPTTFRQACGRMVRVGESVHIFQKRRHGHEESSSSSLKQRVRLAVAGNPYILKACLETANLVTMLVCPNRLMRTALSLHFLHGYEHGTGRHLQKSTRQG